MRTWQVMGMAVLGGLLLVGGCQCGGGEEEGVATDSTGEGQVANLTGSPSFTVTACKKERGSYSVTINKALVIHDIGYAENAVELPFTESRSGYRREMLASTGPDGAILLKDIDAAVTAVANNGSIPKSTAEFGALKVGGIEIDPYQPPASRSGNTSRPSSGAGAGEAKPTMYFVKIVINDSLRIGNMAILQDRDDPTTYSISWPTKKVRNRRIKQLEVINEADLKAIEEEIQAAFIATTKLNPAEIKWAQGSAGGSSEAGSKPANPIFITGITEADGVYTATLWNEVIVTGIKIENGGVVLPESKSGDRTFPFIKPPFQSQATAVEALKKAIEAYAENQTFEKGTSAAFEVTDVHPRITSGGGFSTVTINGSIMLDSFKITDRDGQISVQLPSLNNTTITAFRTASVWTELQKRIADAYRTAKARAPERSSGSGSSRSGSSRSGSSHSGHSSRNRGAGGEE